MERIIEFSPAYDKRPKYGIHGVELRMVLKGPEGAVQFLLYTNWHLAHVQKELDEWVDSHYPHLSCHPLPADLGYHSPVPRFEGHALINDDPCPYLDGKPCYYDGSGLNAKQIYKVLVEEGGEAVWRELEYFYHKVFKSDEITSHRT